MLFVKNLPAWERLVRFAAVLLMAACAWHYKLTPVGFVFGAGAVFTALTAVFGWCPACAIGGRRLKSKVRD